MKIQRWLNCAAIALPLSLSSYAATAQKIDPEKLPKVACSDLVYSQQFLKTYPKAPAACQEARVYGGKKYAKFDGKVFIPGADVVTIQFFNVSGDPLTTVSLKPSPSAKVIVDGKTKTIAQLNKGDPITIWVSEKRFAAYTSPGAKSSSTLVAPAAQ